jgi:hypothetical protein
MLANEAVDIDGWFDVVFDACFLEEQCLNNAGMQQGDTGTSFGSRSRLPDQVGCKRLDMKGISFQIGNGRCPMAAAQPALA